MSALIIFLLFFLFIALAIPIAVSLGIVSVLPGMTDPSFTATASFVIRSMVGGIDSFPLLAVFDYSDGALANRIWRISSDL